LQDRGIPITDEADAISTRQRMVELAQPEAAPLWMFLAGYILAFIGGFGGFVMGRLLSATKILPNGQRVTVYTKSDHAHGRVIMIMGGLLFVTYILISIRQSWR
jgi:hypothetical protein